MKKGIPVATLLFFVPLAVEAGFDCGAACYHQALITLGQSYNYAFLLFVLALVSYLAYSFTKGRSPSSKKKLLICGLLLVLALLPFRFFASLEYAKVTYKLGDNTYEIPWQYDPWLQGDRIVIRVRTSDFSPYYPRDDTKPSNQLALYAVNEFRPGCDRGCFVVDDRLYQTFNYEVYIAPPPYEGPYPGSLEEMLKQEEERNKRQAALFDSFRLD